MGPPVVALALTHRTEMMMATGLKAPEAVGPGATPKVAVMKKPPRTTAETEFLTRGKSATLTSSTTKPVSP